MKGLDEVLLGYLDRQTAEHAIEEVFLIEGKTGKILRAAKPLAHRGSVKSADDAAAAGVRHVLQQVMKLNKAAITDMGINPDAGSVGVAVGVPVFRFQTKDCIGVLAMRINLSGMNKVLDLENTTGGATEAYLVGKNFLVRCGSHPAPESAAQATIRETEAVKQVLDGKTARIFSDNGRGGTSLAMAAPVGMNKQEDYGADFDWVMVVDVDEKEAMARVTSLAWWTAGIASIAALVVSIAGFFVSAGVSAPVIAVANVAREVSRGNLTASLADSGRRDEIGTPHRIDRVYDQ